MGNGFLRVVRSGIQCSCANRDLWEIQKEHGMKIVFDCCG